MRKRQLKPESPEPEEQPVRADVQGFKGRRERALKNESVYHYPFRLLNVINFVTRQP
jgi:hypothetical protein